MNIKQILEVLREGHAADQAHKLHLVKGGFGNWLDPKTRKRVAKTVKDRLVKVSPDEEGEGDELGKAIILDFDDKILHVNLQNPKIKTAVHAYTSLIKKILLSGHNKYFVMISKSDEKEVEDFLHLLGITTNIQFVPIANSDLEVKKKFVENKAKQGFSEIDFFDRDGKVVSAVDSLKVVYNKLDVDIETHQIPSLENLLKNPTQAQDTYK